MNSTHYAADLAETSPHKSVGALRLAAGVGFVLLSTAFTVHSFVISTEPWQPAEPQEVPELGADAAQESSLEWFSPSADPIELSHVPRECVDCEIELTPILPARNEG